MQAGYGLFYDRVPLNVYCFNKYPDQDITMYGDDGEVSAGPFLYLNTLGQVKVKHPFVFQSPQDGNFSPESAIWSLQIEQPLTPFLKLRVGYLQNYSQGPGHPEFRGARPGHQHRCVSALRRGAVPLSPTRGDGAHAAEGRRAPVVLLLCAQPGPRRLERLQQLFGHFPHSHHPRATSSGTCRPICPIAFWLGAWCNFRGNSESLRWWSTALDSRTS